MLCPIPPSQQPHSSVSALALLAVQDTLLALGLSFLTFPRTAQMTESFLGVSHCNSQSVVYYFDGVDPVEAVPTDADGDISGICVNGVPD
jgi:hypothetical protein